MPKKIRVIVVDDSQFIREMFKTILNSDPGIEVVATADDPLDAREKIKLHNPEVITLDIEMPKMDGIEFLQKIMALRPMPVVMASTLTQKGADITLRALELGAVDCIGKPSDMYNGDHFAIELIRKVKNAATANIKAHSRQTSDSIPATTRIPYTGDVTRPLIAIGSSTGGVEALREVLTRLPANCPPIVITQHMPAAFTKSFAERLNKICALTLQESTHGAVLKPGNAYIAFGGAHLLIAKQAGKYVCQHTDGDNVSGHKPSVDVLFDSVATAAGDHAVGAILTGMGKDGAQGLLKMRQAGAFTLGESEASCVVYGMPRAAFELGAIKRQCHLRDMASEILKSCAQI